VQRILIVEDSATMRSLIVSSLEELALSLKVVEAKNGFEALRLLPRESFDLVVTDINMPDINGLELVSFLKNHPVYKTIPIMVISTESTTEDRNRAAALGAEEYLVKPFDPKDLVAKLRKLLRVA
jgi:two-component system chemotaxis response regulator CheY